LTASANENSVANTAKLAKKGFRMFFCETSMQTKGGRLYKGRSSPDKSENILEKWFSILGFQPRVSL